MPEFFELLSEQSFPLNQLKSENNSELMHNCNNLISDENLRALKEKTSFYIDYEYFLFDEARLGKKNRLLIETIRFIIKWQISQIDWELQKK